MEARAPNPKPPAIRMEGVAVPAMRDPGTIVAENVNWTVNAGDYWVVAGLHGAGKSEFLMMTAGLTAPAGGSYRLFGEEMPIFEEGRLRTRMRLGMVFDGGQLFNRLTIWENVALPLRYHRNLARAEAEAEVRTLLEATELGAWAEKMPSFLGRSWQARAGLARALALRPELLLIDNALAGLDWRHLNWWLGFLDQLSKGHPLFEGRPVTLVVSAADLRPWRDRARQFALLKERRLTVVDAWEAAEAGQGKVEG